MEEQLIVKVTKKGWTITYTDERGTEFTETHELTKHGSTVVGVSLEDNDELDYPSLIDAVDSICSGCYDFANSLRE
jgi:hypothetical protein